MFSELYFWGRISIDESRISFEGLYLKKVTVPKSYKVINICVRMEENKEEREEATEGYNSSAKITLPGGKLNHTNG